MRLRMETDYAIRLMICLALEGNYVRAADIAEKMRIPQHMVPLITKRLRKAGMVDSLCGHSGGTKLARSAEQITLLDIVLCMEGPLFFNRCPASGEGCYCGQLPRCPVQIYFERLQEEIEGSMRSVTVAQLAEGEYRCGEQPLEPAAIHNSR